MYKIVFFFHPLQLFHRVRAYLPAKLDQRNIFDDFRLYVRTYDLLRDGCLLYYEPLLLLLRTAAKPNFGRCSDNRRAAMFLRL